jgi:hypothetical protein
MDESRDTSGLREGHPEKVQAKIDAVRERRASPADLRVQRAEILREALSNAGVQRDAPAGEDKAAAGADREGARDADPEDRDRGVAEGAGDEGAGEGVAGEGSEGEPLTIEGVAEKLGISNAELNKVKLKVGPDELTLGELKAALPKVAKLEADREEFSETQNNWSLQKLEEERTLLTVYDQLEGMLPPRAIEAIRGYIQKQESRERALLQSARPKWSDPQYKEGQLERMADAAGKYGVTRAEIKAISDHRIVLMLEDFAAMKAKIEAAKEAARKVAGEQVKSPGQAGAGEIRSSRKAGQMSRGTDARIAAQLSRIRR